MVVKWLRSEKTSLYAFLLSASLERHRLSIIPRHSLFALVMKAADYMVATLCKGLVRVPRFPSVDKPDLLNLLRDLHMVELRRSVSLYN